jgi:ABC-type Fe3+/spermidine/putrescine transport system ATPase subunit
VGASVCARDIRLAFGPAGAALALDVDQFHADAGALVGITGPSGSGKTSLLYVLAGLERPQRGVVRWEGIDIQSLSEGCRDRWRRRTLGFVFQDFHLFAGMTALDNVLLPATFDRAVIPVHVAVGRLSRTGSPWDRAIVAPVEALWRLHARPTGHGEDAHRLGPPWEGSHLAGASAVVVKPRSVADAYRLRGRYRDAEIMAVFPAEVLVEMYAKLGDARDLLSLIGGVTQALVGGAVLLGVFASLTHRRRQLGVLRVLGASRRYVFLAVWAHVTLLVSSGAALGLLLGWGVAWALSGLLWAKTGVGLPVAISWTEVAAVVALVASGAMLALVPAWHAYRQPVSGLLRS